MIVGVGTDIVDIQRLRGVILRHGERFGEKVLHGSELTAWREAKLSISFLAKRFAAKEAVAKALGTGMREGVRFQDIEIVRGELGKPEVRLHGVASARAAGMSLHLSISDEKHYAVAFVVAEQVRP